MKSKSLNYIKNLITENTPKSELDILNYIKMCINNYKMEQKHTNIENLSTYFETLWKIYVRKDNKELAKRTFEHKMRGLTEEQVKEKANFIYISQQKYKQECEQNRTEKQYILHYSSFLNARIPNSPHYKGGNK